MLDPHHPETVAPAIQAAAAGIIATGTRLLAFGGDHFVTWPLLKAHAERHGPLALIHVDAHGDLWPDDPGRIDHGTMMGRAVRDGLVDASRSTQVGIRTFHDSTEGLEVVTAPWVHRNGIAAAVEMATARAGAALIASLCATKEWKGLVIPAHTGSARPASVRAISGALTGSA